MSQCCALLTEFSCGKLALIPFAFCRSPFGPLTEFSYGKLAESFVKTTKTRDIFFKTCVYFCSHFCFSHKNHTKTASEPIEAAVYDFPALNKMQSEVSGTSTAFNKALSETSDGLLRSLRSLPSFCANPVFAQKLALVLGFWFTTTHKMLSESSDGFTATDKTLSEASDGLPATDKVLSEVSDGFTAINKLLSETSDGFTATYRVPSEASDALPATHKVLSEVSDGFTAIDKLLSETSDAPTATDKTLSEASDSLTASDKALSEASDGFTAISKHEFNKQGFALRRNDRCVCGGNIS